MKIGVFDSGVGGLTVLRALLPRIANADYCYLGDTARLPYGSKSQATIARYAASSAQFLLELGCEFLVIACNTASALALPEICHVAQPRGVPVVGVIGPGAAAAAHATKSGSAMVIATSATVESHAYARACNRAGLRAVEKACPLLVPLVEEGWIDHPVTAEVVRIYLSELHRQAGDAGLTPDTIILGCTHYPLLREVITAAVAELWPGSPPCVIDSAEATAREVERQLGRADRNQTFTGPSPGSNAPSHSQQVEGAELVRPGTAAGPKFYATDSVEKFQQLGSRFLGRPIAKVELIDLGG